MDTSTESVSVRAWAAIIDRQYLRGLDIDLNQNAVTVGVGFRF
ncbi:hypothetical protein [Rhizobium mesoamericanum]|nr:hypothetical protein [Rhizobium mesoamericanum]